VSGSAIPRPLADIITVRQGPLVEHELVLTMGASAADVTQAMILMPPDASLISFHGDVDLSLVFREIPRPRASQEDA